MSPYQSVPWLAGSACGRAVVSPEGDDQIVASALVLVQSVLCAAIIFDGENCWKKQDTGNKSRCLILAAICLDLAFKLIVILGEAFYRGIDAAA